MNEEFEVKGLHEEVLEEKKHELFDSKLAVMTALMAGMGALLSYEASLTLGEAILFKNEAAIKKTEASDQWNYYQAKSNKQNMAELAVKLTAGQERENSVIEAKRYEAEKNEIKNKAENFEELAVGADKTSEQYMHAHHRWATGTTIMQIAISLAAISLLTRRRWLSYVSYSCAAVGALLGVLTWFGFH